jgi:putative phosphoesterase
VAAGRARLPGMTRIAIVSDTHMPKGRRELPAECVRICSEADLIVHGGDLSELEVLEMFEAIGPPVVAIHGNVDSAEVRSRLPERRTLEVEDVRIGLIHDAGPKTGRLARLRKTFPGHRAVIFGHSHLPLRESTEDGEFTMFNPGSPTERRRSPFKSMGSAVVSGSTVEFELIDLGL